MKDKIKKYKWPALVTGLLLILGFVFYWYELRPSQIRKMCQEKIEKQDRELLESAIKSKIMKEGGDIYNFCLRNYGLEK